MEVGSSSSRATLKQRARDTSPHGLGRKRRADVRISFTVEVEDLGQVLNLMQTSPFRYMKDAATLLCARVPCLVPVRVCQYLCSQPKPGIPRRKQYVSSPTVIDVRV